MFNVPVVAAKIISPTAYVEIFVPPFDTGTLLVKFAGFKKYALSKASKVPASTTPSLIKTSPLAELLTSNCDCKNFDTPNVE